MAGSAVSAYIQPLELPLPPIIFQYNPEAFTVSAKAGWTYATQPALQGTPPMFNGIKLNEVTVKILLDAFAIPPIPPSATIEQLKVLLLPTPQSMLVPPAKPTTVMFGWGPNIIMETAIVTSLQVAYERFLLGMPVRATATVTLMAVPLPAPLGGTNPTSGGLATRRTRTVVEGDSLASIAFEEFRDPNKWRALAEANNIDDPMRVKEGTVLVVPDQRDAENMSSEALP
jgi:nucleoid-associated protein YgaU